MLGWISLIPRTSERWNVAVSRATPGPFADVFPSGERPDRARRAGYAAAHLRGVQAVGVSTPAAERAPAQNHPITPNGYAAMQAAGGEVAYNAVLARQTSAWISAHPEGTAILLARHIREYFIPPPWFFSPFGTKDSPSAAIRCAYLAVTVLLAIFGMPVLIARNRQYVYVLAAAAILIMPYLLVQPILRYRYLIYTLSVFLAVDVVAALWVRYRQGAKQPARSGPDVHARRADKRPSPLTVDVVIAFNVRK